MKKIAVTAIVVVIGVALVAGWLGIRSLKWSAELFRAKTAKVTRQTVRQPINASGVVQAHLTYDIKSKASGEVKVIRVKEGQYVHEADVLIELDPVDEARQLDMAQNAVARSEALLERAKIALERQQEDYPLSVRIAAAQVDSAKASAGTLEAQLTGAQSALKLASLDSKRVERIGKWMTHEIEQQRSETDLKRAETGVDQLKSQLAGAQAQVTIAEANVERAALAKLLTRDAEQALALAEADHNTAVKNFEEAELRHKETTIRAPVDGLVVRIHTTLGAKIQGGMQSLTGGTVLLRMADMSKLYVVAKVDEADIGRVREVAPGEAIPETAEAMSIVLPKTNPASQPASGAKKGDGTVSITVDSSPEDKFAGIIERIAPQGVQAATIVTYDVFIRVTSPNRHKLFLNSQATVDFTLRTAENALVVPNEAIHEEFGEIGAYIPTTKTKEDSREYKFVGIKTGITDGEVTVVLAGLKEGQKVYTRLPRKLGKDKDEEEE